MLAPFGSLFNYRELVATLVIRGIRSRYKQSLLGILWIVFEPLALVIVFTLVFSLIAKFPSDNIPYPLFAYSGLLVWQFFTKSVTFSIHSLIQENNLVKKVYFPREVLPISSILLTAVDFVVAFLIFGSLMAFYRISLTLQVIWVIPIFLVLAIFTSAFSLLTSALNVFYRDVQVIVNLVLTVWMFITPIIYPISLIPDNYRSIYMINPMTGILDNYRRVLLQGGSPDYSTLLYTGTISILFFLLSYWYFKKVEMRFADVL